jgi:hypothetical protein
MPGLLKGRCHKGLFLFHSLQVPFVPVVNCRILVFSANLHNKITSREVICLRGSIYSLLLFSGGIKTDLKRQLLRLEPVELLLAHGFLAGI